MVLAHGGCVKNARLFSTVLTVFKQELLSVSKRPSAPSRKAHTLRDTGNPGIAIRQLSLRKTEQPQCESPRYQTEGRELGACQGP